MDQNTEKRAKAKNKFEKYYYKLKNNLVFGKIMEDERNRIDVRLISKWDGKYGSTIGNLPKTTTVCPHHNAASGRKINCALHNVKYMKRFYFGSDEMEWEDIEESLPPPLLSTVEDYK